MGWGWFTAAPAWRAVGSVHGRPSKSCLDALPLRLSAQGLEGVEKKPRTSRSTRLWTLQWWLGRHSQSERASSRWTLRRRAPVVLPHLLLMKVCIHV